MTRKPLIAGNWKMNLNHFEAIALFMAATISEVTEVCDPTQAKVEPVRAQKSWQP